MELSLTAIYHRMSILTTHTARLITLNVFFSTTSVNAYSHQKQLLSELGTSSPILEYIYTLWDPHAQKNMLAIEPVQRHAAGYVTNNYSSYASVSDMLIHLQWTSLNN